MKKQWIILISLAVIVLFIVLLVTLDMFDGFVFGGMLFYVLMFLGGYAFIISSKMREQRELAEEANRKKKFDFCLERTNMILRRMPGGDGIQWAGGFGRTSEYRTFYSGVMNHGYRSILGFLANSQQIVLAIYDIEADDIARFVTNPGPELLENHFKNFRPFSRGMGVGDDYDMRPQGTGPYSMYSRRYGSRAPISINVGESQEGRLSSREFTAPKPDDDMVESAVKRVKE